MRRLMVFLALILGLQFAYAGEHEGGINGGGGGTLPTDPAREEWVISTLKSARQVLTLYFNRESQNYMHLFDPINDKVFGGLTGSIPILDVIRDGKIEIARDKPCRDRDGNEVDGSAPGSDTYSICISTFRITPKLTEQNFFSQTLALVAHEFSHLVGLNENEARLLQRDVELGLRGASLVEAVAFLNGAELADDMLVARANFLLLENAYDTDDGEDAYRVSYTLARDFANPTDLRGPFSIYNERQASGVTEHAIKARALHLWACANHKHHAEEQARCAEEYTAAFVGTDGTISARELATRLNWRLPDSIPDGFANSHVMIRKIINRSSFQAEIEDLKTFLEGTMNSVKQLREMRY